MAASNSSSFLIAQAPTSLAAWTEQLRDVDAIPILQRTCEALEELRVDEDRVDANRLGELIATDPLMTLKVLAHVSTHRNIRAVTDMQTVTAALVMMGITPFFKSFERQPTIEERLAGHPAALASLHHLLRRAEHAARLAFAMAACRSDPDAPIIHATSLLHDFTELLVWARAPALGLQIEATQRHDPSSHPGSVQRATLNVEFSEIQHSLMDCWRLPGLLLRVSDERYAASPNVRCVTLAVRLARHSATGWDNTALAEDITEVAALLNMSSAKTLEWVHGV